MMKKLKMTSSTQSPKVCSLRLCLFCCLAYRVIVTIFLNSIYMCSVQFSCSVMSNSVLPHRRQPTRLHHPWDSPGKNTGVGCHFLLQCMKVKSESKVVQSCPTLSNSTAYSPPGSSVHGIFQARVLEWVAVAFSTPTESPAPWASDSPWIKRTSPSYAFRE